MQADVERFLAQLFVNQKLRERFLADPVSTAAGCGLSAEEARGMAAVPASDLQTAARGFERKRDFKLRNRSAWLRRLSSRLSDKLRDFRR